MKISVIIPIYNESSTIEKCLEGLRRLSGNFEVLFADGGSTDDTLLKIGEEYPVISCPKGRAKQMNAAAKKAEGRILWFVHCDSILPETACEEIASAVEHGAEFGCFHIGFDFSGLCMWYNTFMSNLRAKAGKIAFGDQGIFVTRELFEKYGGFPDLPIMEDYEFSRRLKHDRIPLKVLSGRIITSGRRYRTGFPMKTMWKMVYLRFLYRVGVDIQKISDMYRDIR